MITNKKGGFIPPDSSFRCKISLFFGKFHILFKKNNLKYRFCFEVFMKFQMVFFGFLRGGTFDLFEKVYSQLNIVCLDVILCSFGLLIQEIGYYRLATASKYAFL
ncbi:hypothetical protein EGI31_06440 [Lacihabitans soyangensis]|uniref:Uncharacterized protein n=1 Tax=Lacihabitans soyangensis TaxID=869394 RepID=A0AAE3H0A5_9BACT|nr:hypothetical protein [Lacihabitans soyangensis]